MPLLLFFKAFNSISIEMKNVGFSFLFVCHFTLELKAFLFDLNWFEQLVNVNPIHIPKSLSLK